jgi:hypothetical protein
MLTNRIVAGALALFAVIGCRGEFAARQELDLYDAASHFSGGARTQRLPRMHLLRDTANHRIASLCLRGASLEDLERLGATALDERLRDLSEGNVISVVEGTCGLAFPAFIDADRQMLSEIVDAKAAELTPLVETMISRLWEELGDRQDMLFHVLWSRVIDEIWTEAHQLAFPNEALPAVVWIVHPQHPYAVGTNYETTPGHGILAMTWSNHFNEHLSVFHEASYELHQAAWGQEIEDPQVRSELMDYGVLDREGSSRLFTFPPGERLDSVLEEMVSEYAAAASEAYDWEALGQHVGVHPGDAFVVVLHETAYAVFEDLHRAGRLDVPEVLLRGGDKREAVRLVSVALGERPGPLDEAMALYMKAGWHGSEEAVVKFRAALADDPDNVEILWYLGLSLYDIEEYPEAISVLERLVAATQSEPAERLRHDWGRIWIGHVYDVTSDRDRALSFYRSVLDSEATSGPLQMAQYDIGPVTAKEWARQRIEVPFSRRD